MASSNHYSLTSASVWSQRLKRLAVLIGVPLIGALILFLLLWNTFFIYVPPGKVLVIISKMGSDPPEGQRLADSDKGQKGILREVLGEGWHFVLPIVYTTELHPLTVIKPGEIGIVTALDGEPLPAGIDLAQPGQRGIQQMVLPPGAYRLNPYGYKVESAKITQVDPGYIGVKRRLLVSNPNEEKGILKNEILQPGIYYLNTKEFEVIPCEVGVNQKTYQYLKDNVKSTAITFRGQDGYEISLDCTIEYEIFPEDWPELIAEFGTWQKIEDNVIDLYARKICNDQGLNYGAEDFLVGEKREKFQSSFQKGLSEQCNRKRVQVRNALIRNIIIPEKFLTPKREEQLSREKSITSEEIEKTAQTANEVAAAQREIDSRVAEVHAETDRLAALIKQETENVRKLNEANLVKLRSDYQAKIVALDSQRRQEVELAEAEAKKMKESAISSIYKLKMDLFGREGDAYLRYTMAQELNPNMRLRLFQSGPGTLWTNMGDKNMNLFMPLSTSDTKEKEPLQNKEKDKE